MEPFDLLDASEFDTIEKYSLRLLDYSEIKDERALDLLTIELLGYLDRLRKKYNDHPVILEFIADRLSDPDERIHAYLEAIDKAKAMSIDTCSCYISLAEVFKDDFEDMESCKEMLDLAYADATARDDQEDLKDVAESRTELIGS